MRRARNGWCGWVAVALAARAALAAESPQAEPAPTGSIAEIRIALPEGVEPHVWVAPDPNRIAIDLPRGATLPADFAAASSGLLRSGQVTEVGTDRLHVEMELAVGVLERISFEPDAVVLRFTSRFHAAESGDPREQYMLGNDDRIILTVHNQPDLRSELTINRDGLITAPLVGDVRAAGLTPRELGARLSDLLGRYLVDPQVDIEVELYRSQWVVISGEVNRPGRVPLRGGTRLSEVIGEAQGFTERAGEALTISRRIQSSAETAVQRIEREQFENGRSNPTLSHGDIIEVARPATCFVQGEVRQAGEVRLDRGMTLLKVLAVAGGLTEWANRKNVVVLSGRGVEPRERIFDLRDIERGKVLDPVLSGGEVVLVKRRFL